MSDIVKGIGNMIASVFQLIQGVITTIVNTITGTLSAAFHAITSLIANTFHLAEGVVGLVVGNFVIILVAAVAYFGYVQYQRSQGRRVEPLADKIARKTK